MRVILSQKSSSADLRLSEIDVGGLPDDRILAYLFPWVCTVGDALVLISFSGKVITPRRTATAIGPAMSGTWYEWNRVEYIGEDTSWKSATRVRNLPLARHQDLEHITANEFIQLATLFDLPCMDADKSISTAEMQSTGILSEVERLAGSYAVQLIRMRTYYGSTLMSAKKNSTLGPIMKILVDSIVHSVSAKELHVHGDGPVIILPGHAYAGRKISSFKHATLLKDGMNIMFEEYTKESIEKMLSGIYESRTGLKGGMRLLAQIVRHVQKQLVDDGVSISLLKKI